MSDAGERADGFLARWSRRKAQAERVAANLPNTRPETVRAEVSKPGERDPNAAFDTAGRSEPQGERGSLTELPGDDVPPSPSLEDVAELSRGSDFRRFVAPDVAPEVKNAALKKLFTDPHFNVMDGLDTYIDDYGKPDPIPLTMLRQMAQAQALGLFADEDKAAADAPLARATPDGATAAVAPQSTTEPGPAIADDQDAALRLQPLDAAGPPSAAGGAGPDERRER
jgi:hypothetical protein